jgi:hypothetical protein
MKRTPLKRSQKPLRKKALVTYRRPSKAEAEEAPRDMREFFLELWDEREDENGFCYCFETGRPMRRSLYRENSACYDHVLEKHLFPQYKFNKENLIIVLPDVHFQKGTDLNFTPKIKELREGLLEKHKKGGLDG